MLEAKTREQLYKIAEILGMDAHEVFSQEPSAFLAKFEPKDSIQTDIPISFDQMANIVDYLRMCEYQRKCGNIYQGRKQEEKTLPPINANWNFRKNK